MDQSATNPTSPALPHVKIFHHDNPEKLESLVNTWIDKQPGIVIVDRQFSTTGAVRHEVVPRHYLAFSMAIWFVKVPPQSDEACPGFEAHQAE